MNWSVFTDWALTLSNRFFPFYLTLLVHSTVIITMGLLVRHVLKHKGAVVQSAVLQVSLAIVLLNPLFLVILNVAGLNGYSISIVLNSKETTRSAAKNREIVIVPVHVKNPKIITPVAVKEPYTQSSVIPDAESESPVIAPNIVVIAGDNMDEEINKKEYIANPQPVTYNNETNSLRKSAAVYREFINYLPVGLSIICLLLSMFFSATVLYAYVNIRKIRESSFDAGPECKRKCSAISYKLGIKPPPVMQNPSIKSIFIAGIIHPRIYIPSCMLEQNYATTEVFIHELAHLKRHDNVWNFLCQLGKILYPVQPLLRLLINQIHDTSDYVCDDYVVNYGNSGHSFASQLYSMAMSFQNQCESPLNGVSVYSSKSPLVKRIVRIIYVSELPGIRLKLGEICSIGVLFCGLTVLTGFISFNGKTSGHKNNLSFNQSKIDNITHPIKYSTIPPGNEKYTAVSSDNSNTTNGTAEDYSNLFHPKKLINSSLSPEFSSVAEERKIPEQNPVLSTQTSSAIAMLDNELQKCTTERITEFYSEEPQDFSGRQLYNYRKIDCFGSNELFDANGMTAAGYGFAGDNSMEYITADIEDFTPLISVSEYFESVYPVDVTARKEIYTNAKTQQFDPVWSPDGKYIAFTDGDYGIWIVPVEGGEPVLLYSGYGKTSWQGISFPSAGTMNTFEFTPEGDAILFQRYIIDESKGTVVESHTDSYNRLYSYRIDYLVPVIGKVNIETAATQTVKEEAKQGRLSVMTDDILPISIMITVTIRWRALPVI